jgi:hypothetical protein
MLTQELIRMRIIRIVREHNLITRARLLHMFAASYRDRFDSAIGKLLSDGVLISTGTGRRGDPATLHMGPMFPKNRCPMCLQELLQDVKITY